ncbi:MAG: (4Fe-4S)-binding protein [Bacteroidota bacterium]
MMKRYANKDITVVWKPDLCVHSTHCWKQLSSVFDPQKKPWINMEQGDTEQIKKQVSFCPSGALSYFDNQEADSTVN